MLFQSSFEPHIFPKSKNLTIIYELSFDHAIRSPEKGIKSHRHQKASINDQQNKIHKITRPLKKNQKPLSHSCKRNSSFTSNKKQKLSNLNLKASPQDLPLPD